MYSGSPNKKRYKDQYDKMMNMPVPKLIVSLSVPTVISMMVSNLYNVVDTAFVGKLGTSASGAVGIVFGFMSILQALGFTFGQGSGSIISRRLGDRDTSNASVVASTAFASAFSLAIAAAVICYVFLDPIIMGLGSTDTIAPYAKIYITYILITAPFMVSSFTINNILRYEGKAFYGMIGLLSGALLNILGDMLFMFVLHMGIAGAGLSTAISQVISFCILLIPFFRGQTQCRFSIRNVRLAPGILGDIVATGLPSLLRQGLGSITTIILNTEASAYGDAGVAGMSIVSRLFFFIFSICIGVGQGFQPVCGFSYGAKRYDRLKEGFKFSVFLGEALMLILGAVLFIKAPFFITLLRDDPEVVNVADRALKLQCIAVLFLPLCMNTEMLMQCTGQKISASLLSALRNGVIFIPLLLILSRTRGLAGIQEAQPLSYVIAFTPGVMFALHFFKKLERTKTDTAVQRTGD
ncbi:MAG: MATE family efflux transporter [Lachnospiraceae bacterium]|nr:MATE family efflux transporter [Lachnospiraceae bacterium]